MVSETTTENTGIEIIINLVNEKDNYQFIDAVYRATMFQENIKIDKKLNKKVETVFECEHGVVVLKNNLVDVKTKNSLLIDGFIYPDSSPVPFITDKYNLFFQQHLCQFV